LDTSCNSIHSEFNWKEGFTLNIWEIAFPWIVFQRIVLPRKIVYCYSVYQAFRLKTLEKIEMITYGTLLITFEVSNIFWGCRGRSENRLEPKIKPSVQFNLVKISDPHGIMTKSTTLSFQTLWHLACATFEVKPKWRHADFEIIFSLSPVVTKL